MKMKTKKYIQKVIEDMFTPEVPPWFALSEDIEIDEEIIKAGVYINGVRQDD